MKVRKDITVWPNDETGAFTLDRPESVRVTALIVFVRRSLEEQIVEWRTLAAVVFFEISIMTTLGATVSKTFANALFN